MQKNWNKIWFLFVLFLISITLLGNLVYNVVIINKSNTNLHKNFCLSKGFRYDGDEESSFICVDYNGELHFFSDKVVFYKDAYPYFGGVLITVATSTLLFIHLIKEIFGD